MNFEYYLNTFKLNSVSNAAYRSTRNPAIPRASVPHGRYGLGASVRRIWTIWHVAQPLWQLAD